MVWKILRCLVIILITSLYCLGQSASVTQGCIPLEVVFQAPAAAKSYFWDFKDGVTSNRKTASNLFNKPGTYRVTFQETPSGPVTGTIVVKVFQPPVIKINSTSGCLPFLSPFKNLSEIDTTLIPVKSYTWVFGDGQTYTGKSVPQHLYNAPGFYNVAVQLETGMPTCNRTANFPNAVEAISLPFATFTTDPAVTSTCADSLQIAFTNISTGSKPLNYKWDFGNGETSSLRSPDKTVYKPGQFNARLTASYVDYPACTSIFNKDVNLKSPPKTSIFTKRDTVCGKDTVMLKTTAIGKAVWSAIPSVTYLNTNADSTQIIVRKKGLYKVKVEVAAADSLCSYVAVKEIFVDSLTAKITSSNPFSCLSAIKINYKGTSNRKRVKYLWDFQDEKDSSSSNVEHTFNSKLLETRTGFSGEQLLDVFLLLTDSVSGCKAKATVTDTLWRPRARIIMDSSHGCIPLHVNFQDRSAAPPKDNIVKWIWNIGNGKDTTLLQSGMLQNIYSEQGRYPIRLIIETGTGCRDTTNSLVRSGLRLGDKIDFTADKSSVCLNEQFLLKPILPTSPKLDSYKFITNAKTESSCFANFQENWQFKDTAGTQDISMNVLHNGCKSSITKKAFIKVKGAFGKGDFFALCKDPYKYNFKSSSISADNVKWFFGDGSTASGDFVTHDYSKTGDYQVVLQAINDTSVCPTDFDTLTVHVRDVKARIIYDSSLCINVPKKFNAKNSTDVSIGCYSGYTWLFSSEELRPYTTAEDTALFSFSEKGVQWVHLIVKDINDCKDTAHARIKIFDMDLRTNSDKSLICPPNSIQFADSSSGDTTLVKWEWNFDDNSSVTNKKNPLHTFISPTADGVFNVRLQVTDTLGCSKELKMEIKQYRPISIITASDSTVCQDDSIKLQASDFTLAGSHLTYKWKMTDGTQSVSQAQRLRYDTSGTYKVRLYYNEVSSGCNDSTYINIKVQDYPKAVIFSNVDSLKTLCAPQGIFFNDKSISANSLSQFWDFGDGTTSSFASHTLSFNKGRFVVKHRVTTEYGCADSVQKVYRVLRPEGDFEIDPKGLICKGDSIIFTLKDTVDVVSYSWAFGDGSVVENFSPVAHEYNFHPPSGQTLARLLLKGREGCQFSPTEKAIRIHQVIAAFERETGIDTSICFSEGAYHFRNTSLAGTKISWDFGDKTNSDESNPAHSYNKPGVYNVKLSILDEQTGCRDTMERIAVIYRNPDLKAKGDTACPGTGLFPMVINPKETSNFQWFTENGTFAAEGPEPVLLGKSIQNYEVIETDVNGCKDTSIVRTQVLEPIALMNFDTTLVLGDSVKLPVNKTDLFNFKWSVVEGLSCTNCNYPIARPFKDTKYTLTVTDVIGCTVPVFEFNIIVRPETLVALPGSFTPNADGINDVIKLNGWGIKELEEFMIFNRWGQIVFSTNKVDEGWDGKMNNVDQPTDVYVYKVRARDFKDKVLYQEGFINLLH